MKRFIVRLSLFFLIIVACDSAIGGLYWLYYHTKLGYTHLFHRIMTEEEPDILILGSSRAFHHYVPSILSDSLDHSVYNAGMDAQGTSFAYPLYRAVAQRKTPRMVVCELLPDFDLYEGNEPSFDFLYPYLGSDGLENVIIDFDSTQAFKLRSNAYKMNSTLFNLIYYTLVGQSEKSDGYAPLYNRLDTTNLASPYEKKPRRISPKKEKWFRTLIEECDANGSIIVFFISPVYGGYDIDDFSDELSIIREYGKPVFDHRNDTLFINDPSLFQDIGHLNDTGAKKYTSVVASELRELSNSN